MSSSPTSRTRGFTSLFMFTEPVQVTFDQDHPLEDAQAQAFITEHNTTKGYFIDRYKRVFHWQRKPPGGLDIGVGKKYSAYSVGNVSPLNDDCFYHSRSHLGWHFRMLFQKLIVQSSNVSFHWNVAKEKFELWALSFWKCHPKWDWLYL